MEERVGGDFDDEDWSGGDPENGTGVESAPGSHDEIPGGRLSLKDKLLQAVRQSGWSHYELAKRSNLSAQAVMRFAKGERSLNLESASRLCVALGLEVVEDDEDQFKELLREHFGLEASFDRLEGENAALRAALREATKSRGPKLRYSLDNLLVMADNAGSRSLLEYGIRIRHDIDRIQETQCLHHLLSGLLERNPNRKELFAIHGLATAVEILLSRIKDPESAANFGASMTPGEAWGMLESRKL
jgi:transcriptional regulator with XRE-family HTH domain